MVPRGIGRGNEPVKDWVAIIVAAVIIAAAILFVFRWQTAPIGSYGAILLDRWTGEVVVCLPPVGEPPQMAIYKHAVKYDCNPKHAN
jgi:hypothetical protein